MNVHNNFACNGPKLGTTQMSNNREVGEQTVVRPQNGTVRSNQKEWPLGTHNNADKSQNNLAK